ncbi:hypothetical protein DPSP01_013021 [Paraphaeosphaeria sporulosa]
MQALNPIACEHCRSKKCKCDRKLPHCSQCRALSLACRYAEGGKRGIPAAYINSLEDRLAETEAALYSALATINSVHNGTAGLHRLLTDASGPVARERSKIEKQDEWKRLPLRSGEQLRVWFEEKSQSDHQLQHMRSSTNGHPPSIQSEELARSDAADVVHASLEPAHTAAEKAATSHTPTSAHLPTHFHDPAQWRNYF